jgi:SEC10/PgrA surface exclusion-like protein/LPXTG-motif cell wall-anchored protein
LQNQVKNLQDQEKNTQTDPNIKNFDGHVVDTSKSLLENASRNNLWDNYYDNTQDASTWNGNVIPQNIYVSPDNNKTEDHSSLGPAQPNLDYYNTLSQDVDVVNGQMTDAQKQELAILMLNEINHAREQRGLKPFVMTEQKYQQAQVRASQHSAQVLDHNENDIMTAFGQDQYECLAYIPLNDTHSLYDLLNQASNSLSNMLNADASSDWGHRENFLEDTGTLSANAAFGMHLTDDGQYYVLTFDYDLSNPDSTPNMMDRIAQYQAMGPITGDAHTVDNSAQINDLNNQISNLQNTLASQQSHLNDLTTQLQNLQAQKANVQFDLSQLSSDQQAEYNNAKHTLDTINDWKNGQLANINKDGHVQEAINKLSSAKSNYKSAQEAQAQDETNLQQAKDGLASLNQVLATKQVALDTAEQKANAQANQVVKDKQAKLDAIKSHINDLQNAIATTKATINNAQAQLDKDNQKIADIKNGQKPVDSNKGDDKPTNPTTPTNPSKPNTGKDDNNKGNQPTTPTNPSKGDDKPTNPTTPTNPTKPNTGKDDNKGDQSTTPTNPSKGDDKPTNPTAPTNPTTPTKPDDNKSNKPVTPTNPAKPDNGNKGTDTPVTPSKPTDNKGDQPTTPTTPAQPDHGNASISGQAGHKPATSDNGSQATDSNATNKPTIVLPTNGSQSAANTQGQSVNMTREQYKQQQASLPQTGNENSKAVIALGVLAGMFGLGVAAKGKKEF